MADDNGNAAEAYQKLLEKSNNDSGQLALKLFGENFELREKNRELKKSVPADGSIVLSKEDAAKWNAQNSFFERIGKSEQEIEDALKSNETLTAENQKLTKRDSLREVERLGYKLPVLEDQMGKFPNATITVKKQKDAKDATKEVEVPYVMLDGKESSLEDFAKANFADYLPVLKAEQTVVQKPGHSYDPPPHKPNNAETFTNEVNLQRARSGNAL